MPFASIGACRTLLTSWLTAVVGLAPSGQLVAVQFCANAAKAACAPAACAWAVSWLFSTGSGEPSSTNRPTLSGYWSA